MKPYKAKCENSPNAECNGFVGEMGKALWTFRNRGHNSFIALRNIYGIFRTSRSMSKETIASCMRILMP